MKSNQKTRTLIILGIIFVFSTIFATNSMYIRNYENKSSDYSDEINFDNENLRASKISGKIHIDNNWTDARDVGICTGNGTHSEPYVIEDLIIDGGNSGSCILIENSNAFFRIENCTIYNSGIYNSGIHLINVNNSQLIGNNCSFNDQGIYLQNCNFNNITENIVYNNSGGIDAIGSNNILSGNIVYNNGGGIGVIGPNNIVSGNIANYNGVGIVVHGSFAMYESHNIIANNDVRYNDKGLDLYRIENSRISGNTAIDNEYGMYFENCNHNDVINNTINYNIFGMYIDDCDGNNITGNTVHYNNYSGLWLVFSYHQDIIDNSIKYNGEGLYLQLCGSNEIIGNTIYNNRAGVTLQSSEGNRFYLNNFANVNASVLYYDWGYTNDWISRSKIKYIYKDKTYTNYLGNFWNTYNGTDDNNDGIGDTSFLVFYPDIDNYPLIESNENYEILPSDTRKSVPGYNLFFLFGILLGLAIFTTKRLKKLV